MRFLRQVLLTITPHSRKGKKGKEEDKNKAGGGEKERQEESSSSTSQIGIEETQSRPSTMMILSAFESYFGDGYSGRIFGSNRPHCVCKIK